MTTSVTIEALDVMVDAVLASTEGDRALLGICGPPGSGKSFLARHLASRANARVGTGTAAVLPMDGFHLANEVLVELGRRDHKGAPDTFDVRGFAAMLDHVRFGFVVGERVYAPRFDREIESAIAGSIAIPALARVVIVEGNYLLHDDGPWATVAPRIDETWYLDVPADVRQLRLMERHRVGHGDGAAEWIRRVDEPNATLVEQTKGRADRVVGPPDLTDAA
jgi:pantothenate kinase